MLSTQIIQRFATGAMSMPNQLLERPGNGTLMRVSGTNGMMVVITTGVHPKRDLNTSGPGIRDTGITKVTYINTLTTSGRDSKEESGSTMMRRSTLTPNTHTQENAENSSRSSKFTSQTL